MTAILTGCLVAVAGCQGSAAQEPYDGVIAAVQRAAKAPVVPALRAPGVEPIASEVDVPWAIALLSDATPAPVKKPGKVIVVDADAHVPETVVEAVHLDVAVDPASVAEKPATPKTCSGVVKSRS